MEVEIVNISDTLNVIKPKVETWKSKKSFHLPYEIYHWEIADVDHDNCDEILVGVIKSTRFDPKLSKRLFILKNYEGYIRPKWLGSRLSQPIVNFKTINLNGTKVLSIEKEKSGKTLLAVYEYSQFGLEFQFYLIREIELVKANSIFRIFQ